ncbi:MAG: laccase domain-containing protein [Myxococcales bacterium FL481]|nr:MAG: laccase domain-containing protein [Myxococcales bacterium FL481]
MTEASVLTGEGFHPNVVHGFTTRLGGVSRGRFASLNLGATWGDDPLAVAENLRRVGALAGFSPTQLVRAHQVHGATVVSGDAVSTTTKADGLWLTRRHAEGRFIAVTTADCVPVLLADDAATVVAAVHSGWRGTVAGVVTEAVRGMAEAGGVPAERLGAAIGPCIEQAAFEVGDEVAAEFDPRFVTRAANGRAHVDLVACVREQLVAAGLDPRSVRRVGGCTHAQPQRHFSYRRDGRGGQQISFIGFRP